jgi:hypothetical protein
MMVSNFPKHRLAGSKVILQGLVFIVIVLCSVNSAQAQWTSSANNIYNSNSGNVGIGTTSPSTKLDVNGPMKLEGSNVFEFNTGNEASGVGAFMLFDTTSSLFYVQAIHQGVAYLPVSLNPWGGNVGIGTTSPSSALDVVGDVTVSGNISAKYQDLAEWVAAALAISPGTVVIQNPNGINSVIPSTESYDTRVAGVVSANPGIVLGEAGDGKVRVATTGRVKVHADASHAPIRAGDLLVTSDKEGTAMRSEPIEVAGVKIHRPGTLIGKALEPLNGGEGEILVLLSLQ